MRRVAPVLALLLGLCVEAKAGLYDARVLADNPVAYCPSARLHGYDYTRITERYLLAEMEPIPEPGSLALLGLGIAALAARRRRRNAPGRRKETSAMSNTRSFGLALALAAGLLAATAHAAPIAPPVPTTAWLLDEGIGSTVYQLAGPRTGTIFPGGAGTLTWSTDVPLATLATTR